MVATSQQDLSFNTSEVPSDFTASESSHLAGFECAHRMALNLQSGRAVILNKTRYLPSGP